METKLKGAFVIEIEKREDDRGFFARSLCMKEFEAQGLNVTYVQSNISFNLKTGTLRGMHRQLAPYGETKLVRCVSGRIFDVIVDLREKSKTFKHWFSVELSQDNRKTLYVPKGFAHGFLTLEDNSEVFYQHSQYYTPEAEGGVRWDDPAFGIRWPSMDRYIISNKDQHWPLYL